MEEALRVLTGLASGTAWALTNSAADPLVLTAGGLGGRRSVCATAGAAGEVRLTYSDRSISNWGTQEPTNQSRAQPAELNSVTMRRNLHVKTAQTRLTAYTPRKRPGSKKFNTLRYFWFPYSVRLHGR